MNKLELRRRLKTIFESHFNNKSVQLYIVGSSVTGLGVDQSDIDMSLLISETDLDQTYEAGLKLDAIRKRLSLEPDLIKTFELVRARVCLLRFETYFCNLKVDLTLGNSSAIRSTHLVSCYVRLDPRVRPLVVAVKLWAKKYSINEAFAGGLSSYSLILMVIGYLQFGCSPAVLPCLQTLRPYSFGKHIRANDLTLSEPTVYDYSSSNKKTVDQLLIGFFKYFGTDITLRDNVVSIKQGSLIPRATFRLQSSAYSVRPKRWQYVCIEEPFDGSNTAASIFRSWDYSKIVQAMKDAHSKLALKGDLYQILKEV